MFVQVLTKCVFIKQKTTFSNLFLKDKDDKAMFNNGNEKEVS